MTENAELNGLAPALFDALRPGEQIVEVVRVDGATLILTTDRIAVGVDKRLQFDVRIAGLRRIQFDLEAQRPATLSIVPESAGTEPSILTVMPEAYDDVSRVLAHVGAQLDLLSHERSTRNPTPRVAVQG